MGNGINILDDKHTQFRTWVENIAERRGLNSTLTVGQIVDMLDLLDGVEEKTDEIIMKAFNE